MGQAVPLLLYLQSSIIGSAVAPTKVAGHKFADARAGSAGTGYFGDLSLLQTSATSTKSLVRHARAMQDSQKQDGSVDDAELFQGALPCHKTPGGGCQGGLAHGNKKFKPAPPNHFPTGCKWQTPKRIALVHVGKCAGTSIVKGLRNTPINFTHVHMKTNDGYFDPAQYDLFVITTRDPVSRIVSNFNWRHIYGGRPVTPIKTWIERSMYKCFPEYPGGVSSFAESLDEDSKCGYLARRCLHDEYARCGHMAKGFRWYLRTGLQRGSPSVLSELATKPHKHALAVSTEHFAADIAAMWDWLCVPPDMRPSEKHKKESYPREDDKNLTQKGMETLRKHTTLDAQALEELLAATDFPAFATPER